MADVRTDDMRNDEPIPGKSETGSLMTPLALWCAEHSHATKAPAALQRSRRRNAAASGRCHASQKNYRKKNRHDKNSGTSPSFVHLAVPA
jgi:hypothetical protein